MSKIEAKLASLTEVAREHGVLQERERILQYGFLAAIDPEVSITRANYALGSLGYHIELRDDIFVLTLLHPEVA